MDLMEKVIAEVNKMSIEERLEAEADSAYLLFLCNELVVSGDDLKKMPSRDDIARACFIVYRSLGAKYRSREQYKILTEICDFTKGVSLVEISPRLQCLSDAFYNMLSDLVKKDEAEAKAEAERLERIKSADGDLCPF